MERLYEMANEAYENLLGDNKIFVSEQVKEAFIQGWVKGYQECYSRVK